MRAVLCASHDTASAVLAAPIASDCNAPYLSSGTWSLLGIEQSAPHTDESSRIENFSNEGGGNGTIRWQKNIMGLWMLQSVRHELDDRYTFPQLSELAEKSCIASVVDAQDSRLLAPESMSDTIRQLCAESGQAVPGVSRRAGPGHLSKSGGRISPGGGGAGANGTAPARRHSHRRRGKPGRVS